MNNTKKLIATVVSFISFSVTASVAASCGGSLTAPYGVFNSPHYPNDYRNNEECHWDITAAEGQNITLYFTSFNLEDHSTCDYDSVTVYDGISPLNRQFIGQFCGSIPPRVVQASRGFMKIVFKTDHSGVYSGFQAVYVTSLKSEATCGGDLIAPRGIIQFPQYPIVYHNSKECEWDITVDEGNVVSLEFVNFTLRESASCQHDNVTVYDGNSAYSSVIGKFCGGTLPGVMLSSERYMKIVFKTNGSGRYTGFQAMYSSLVPQTRLERVSAKIFIPVALPLGVVSLILAVALLYTCAKRRRLTRQLESLQVNINQDVPMDDLDDAPRYVTTSVDDYMAPASQVPIRQQPLPPIPIEEACCK